MANPYECCERQREANADALNSDLVSLDEKRAAPDDKPEWKQVGSDAKGPSQRERDRRRDETGVLGKHRGADQQPHDDESDSVDLVEISAGG